MHAATTDRRAVKTTAIAIPPSTLSHTARQGIFFYLGVLIVLLAFGGPSGGLIDIRSTYQ